MNSIPQPPKKPLPSTPNQASQAIPNQEGASNSNLPRSNLVRGNSVGNLQNSRRNSRYSICLLREPGERKGGERKGGERKGEEGETRVRDERGRREMEEREGRREEGGGFLFVGLFLFGFVLKLFCFRKSSRNNLAGNNSRNSSKRDLKDPLPWYENKKQKTRTKKKKKKH